MEYFYKNQVQAYIALWEYPESFSTNSNKVDWKKHLQVHRVESLESKKSEVLGFTRSAFGPTWWLFILEGTLKINFENCRHEFEKTVNRIEKDI